MTQHPTPVELEAEARCLREAREKFLVPRTTQDIIEQISAVAALWLDPTYGPRIEACRDVAQVTGFPEGMIGWGLDRAFGQLRAPVIQRLLESEFGGSLALEGGNIDAGTGRRRVAVGPGLITHIIGGVIPSPGLWNLCFGLLVRSSSLVKVSSREPVFLQHFSASLRTQAPDLAACITVCHWHRDDEPLTRAALGVADAVVAFGDDETIRCLAGTVVPPRRFVGYGHRVSLAVIEESGMSHATATGLAEDVAFYDQQGCLSPQVAYVIASPSRCLEFCETVAAAMAAMERRLPRRRLSPSDAAVIQGERAAGEMRQAAGDRVRMWASEGSTAWTVIYDEDPLFHPSCLNRLLRVKRINSLGDLPAAIRQVWGRVQGVAVAPADAMEAISRVLRGSGASWVCAPGRLQEPPLGWPDDGWPPLSRLLSWVEISG